MEQANTKKNANEMTFFEHIEELRWHILRSFLAILVISIVVFIMKTFVFQYVILGPTTKDFVTYQFFCTYLPDFCFFPDNLEIITRDRVSKEGQNMVVIAQHLAQKSQDLGEARHSQNTP